MPCLPQMWSFHVFSLPNEVRSTMVMGQLACGVHVYTTMIVDSMTPMWLEYNTSFSLGWTQMKGISSQNVWRTCRKKNKQTKTKHTENSASPGWWFCMWTMASMLLLCSQKSGNLSYNSVCENRWFYISVVILWTSSVDGFAESVG